MNFINKGSRHDEYDVLDDEYETEEATPPRRAPSYHSTVLKHSRQKSRGENQRHTETF